MAIKRVVVIADENKERWTFQAGGDFAGLDEPMGSELKPVDVLVDKTIDGNFLSGLIAFLRKSD